MVAVRLKSAYDAVPIVQEYLSGLYHLIMFAQVITHLLVLSVISLLGRLVPGDGLSTSCFLGGCRRGRGGTLVCAHAASGKAEKRSCLTSALEYRFFADLRSQQLS